MSIFSTRFARLDANQRALLTRKNTLDPQWDNGLFERWAYPGADQRPRAPLLAL